MKKSQSKAINFLKQNAVYLVIAFCILAIGLSATLMLANRQNSGTVSNQNPPSVEVPDDNPSIDPPENPDGPVIEPEEPDEPEVPEEPVVEPISFVMPVSSFTDIEYYSETMVFNSTLNHYTAHLAIDFFAPEGSSVFAVCDGVVSAVEKTLLEGVTVTIDHGNGLYSIYNSLSDPDFVTVGQQVEKGELIGEVSTTNRKEYKAGAHLHFQVIENGELIDPEKYLVFEHK